MADRAVQTKIDRNEYMTMITISTHVLRLFLSIILLLGHSRAWHASLHQSHGRIGSWRWPTRRRQQQQTSTVLYAKQRTPKWITCASTNEMVHAVSTLIRPNDVVAEIGAQLREVSAGICEQLRRQETSTQQGRAILIDVERKAPKNTNNLDRIKAMRYPGEEESFYPDVATFYEVQNLDEWRHVLRQASERYDVLVLDLNNIVGNDLDLTAVALLKEFDALFEGYRLVIIKSLSLNQWAARLVHAQKWIDQAGQHDDIPPPHIVGTVGVQEYRKTIPYSIKSGDAVLEVGCHLGTSTVLLHSQAGSAGYALGVDVGPKIIAGAKERYPNVAFAVGDAWKTASLLRLQAEHCGEHDKIGYDVVYVDVGGLSGSDGLLEALSLLSALMNALEPRCIVIKSLCIRRLSSRLVPYWQLRKAQPA